MENSGVQRKQTNVDGINQEEVIGATVMMDVTKNLHNVYENIINYYASIRNGLEKT